MNGLKMYSFDDLNLTAYGQKLPQMMYKYVTLNLKCSNYRPLIIIILTQRVTQTAVSAMDAIRNLPYDFVVILAIC
jgi:hypothetical protein